jgi:hypothetical protein
VNGLTVIGIEHNMLLVIGDTVLIFCVINVEDIQMQRVGHKLAIKSDVNTLLFEY